MTHQHHRKVDNCFDEKKLKKNGCAAIRVVVPRWTVVSPRAQPDQRLAFALLG
jgi:hypothetical protein